MKPQINLVYYGFYLSKLVVLINSKIISNLFKFKKFGEGTLPQMIVDATELENCFTQIGKLDPDQKNIQTFIL